MNCLYCHLPITSDQMKNEGSFVDYHRECFERMEQDEQSELDYSRAEFEIHGTEL